MTDHDTQAENTQTLSGESAVPPLENVDSNQGPANKPTLLMRMSDYVHATCCRLLLHRPSSLLTVRLARMACAPL